MWNPGVEYTSTWLAGGVLGALGTLDPGGDGEPDTVAVGDGEGIAVADADGEGDTLGDGETEGYALGDGDGAGAFGRIAWKRWLSFVQ